MTRLMNKVRAIARTWKLLYLSERFKLLWAVGLVLTGIYATVTAYLAKEIIDSVIAHRGGGIFGLSHAFVLGVTYGIITLLQGFVSSYSSVELLTIKDRISRVTDVLLMNRAASSFDITAFETPETRDRIRLASIGARSLPKCFSQSVETLQYVVTIVGLSLIFIYYHPLILAMVFLPSIPLFYTQLKIRAHTYSALVHKSPRYRQMGYLIELMLGAQSAKEIRVYGSGLMFLNKYRRAADEIFMFARDHRLKAMIGNLAWGSVAGLGIGGAYLYIIYLATIGAITIGDVVMYSGAVLYTGGSVRALIQTVSSLWTSVLEVESFFSFLDDRPLQPSASADVVQKSSAGGDAGCKEWVLSDVSFSYPGGGERALEGVSFSIGPKEKVAIVGLNGAGKTTLLKLMLRLFDPDEGSILFRGVDLREWDIRALRREFGVVFQDFSRFKLTLYENIALAANGRVSSGALDDIVLRAARLTGAHEIATNSRDGYRTLLGKEFVNGTEPSGGQWQRIALARGFARDASVIFLDEPSSSLDAKAEQAVFEQVLALAENKTAVVISHRLSITPLVDRILVIQEGQLIEEGSHSQLLRRGGEYARMYRTQAAMYWPNAV